MVVHSIEVFKEHASQTLNSSKPFNSKVQYIANALKSLAIGSNPELSESNS